MATAEYPQSSHGEIPEQIPRESTYETKESTQADLVSLLDQTDWVYFSLDSSGRLIEASNRLAQLLLTTPKDLVGTPLTSLCVPPYDNLLSDHLFKENRTVARRLQADRLHLFLSIRSPSASNDQDHASPPARITSSDSPSREKHVAIPIELVMVFSSDGLSSPQAGTPVTIKGLLRPMQQTPTLPGESESEGTEESTPLAEAEQLRMHHQLHAIMRIGQRVATFEDLDILLSHVVNSLHNDLHYRYADVYLLNDEKTKAHLRASSTSTQDNGTNATHHATHDKEFLIGEEGVLGRTVIGGETVLVNDVTRHAPDVLFRRHFDIESALAIPLAVSEGVNGVLVVQSDTQDAFTLNDVVSLQILADQIAIAIQNTSLLSERDQRLAELSALNQIGMLLASPSGLIDTLDTIIQRVSALFQVEAASLLLVEGGTLYFKVAAGTHIDQVRPFTLEIGQGIAGWAVQHNQTVRVDDVASDPRHYPGIDQMISFDTRSLIAAPLRIAERPDAPGEEEKKEQVIGVIEIINRLDGHPFTRDDEVVIEFIASSAAVVIENVRLFNELQRRLSEMSALLDASRAVTTLELQEVLNTIVERVSTALNAEQAFVYLLDDDKHRLVPRATNSVFHEEVLSQMVFSIGQGTVGTIAETRQALYVDDAQNNRHFSKISSFSGQVHCTLGVPLTVQDELIGVLEVVNKRNEKRFTPADEALLSAFAGQVALSIHNARLYREVQRQVDALATLGQASDAINRASRPDEILVAAIETTAALVPSNHGIALMLRDAQSRNLSVATFQGLEEAIIDALPSLALNESDQQGVSLIYPGTHPSSQEPAPLLGVPLQGREEVIGLIVLRAALPSQEICQLLQTLGDMVAIAIEKARLNEETSRRLAEVSTLYTLANQVITILDLDRILETTTNIINRSLDCQGCCIYLQEPQTGDLTLRASSGWGRRQQEAADLDLIYQVSLRAVRERQPINLTDKERNKSQDPDTLIRSLLVVPLITQNTVIGTLSVDDRAPKAFGPSEGRLLTIAAAQVSVAIENARLLRNLRNRAIQLEQALDELRELHRLKTEFVQNLSHELRTPLTFVKSYVQLILEEAMGEINTDLRGALAIVDRRTDAVIRLVNDVISLEQVEMGQFEFQPISLAAVATQSVEGAAVTARNADVSIDLTAEDNLPLIPADSGRLGQVFDNLLGNAIKFSPAGSVIQVRVWRDGAFVRADVEDQGIGIPAEKLEQIFDRFYQVDGSTTRRYGGTGLGLAIVKTIVESHGGQVAVESELGMGSVFSVLFPVPPLLESR